jgi:hypothetical protein
MQTTATFPVTRLSIIAAHECHLFLETLRGGERTTLVLVDDSPPFKSAADATKLFLNCMWYGVCLVVQANDPPVCSCQPTSFNPGDVVCKAGCVHCFLHIYGPL